MLTEEKKRRIVNAHLERIYRISDKEYQRRVWIRGEGPECEDFDEICCFFGEMGDYIMKNYKDFGLTENQYTILRTFRDQFQIFSDKNDWPPAFIDTPEWTRITIMAKEVLEAFDYKK